MSGPNTSHYHGIFLTDHMSETNHVVFLPDHMSGPNKSHYYGVFLPILAPTTSYMVE